VVGGTEVACEAMGGTHDHHEGQQPTEMETPVPRGAAANGTGVTRATEGAMSRVYITREGRSRCHQLWNRVNRAL
jgi:hypothetical protein